MPNGVRVLLATGHADMRKALRICGCRYKGVLRRDPPSGQLFCFCGRNGNLLKVSWHDGRGACLVMKWLERGRFLWPSAAEGALAISPE
jgi:transposase